MKRHAPFSTYCFVCTCLKWFYINWSGFCRYRIACVYILGHVLIFRNFSFTTQWTALINHVFYEVEATHSDWSGQQTLSGQYTFSEIAEPLSYSCCTYNFSQNTWLRVLRNMLCNACAENAFESSCSGWWTRIAAAPYFLDRTWPLNQYAYKNKYYSKLRHHHIVTLPRAERTISTYLKKA